MKHLKKLLALVSVLLLIVSSSAVLASAATTSTIDAFNPLLRYWHYGAYPDTVTYTSTGYTTLESTHFARQHQVCFYGQPIQNDWNALIKNACSSADGILRLDVNVQSCQATWDQALYEEVGPQIQVMVQYKYKDASGQVVTEDVTHTGTVGDIKIGETKPVYLVFDKDVTQYNSFEVSLVKLSVMNYACLKNAKGEEGCGNFKIVFSPVYLNGTTAPAKGISLGANFNPDLYSWETAANVTSNNPGTLPADGPFKGGVDLKRNSKNVPYLANGTLASIKPTQTTTKPVCKHAVKTTKVTKAATYFSAGVKTTYCASCKKVLGTSAIAKKTLAKPSIKATGAKKSVKITWKKVTGATGYVVEMKSGKKYKVVKTINKGKTTSFTKKGLKKGQKYSFRVKALVKSGSKKAYSKYSSVKTAKAK